MAINFNTGPYYDDFDPEKNFYKVLFKPGYAVQARELNQLQSILQHQVAGIGNHLFKKNTMVQGTGVSLNENADIVFVSSSSAVKDLSTLVGKTITNTASFDFTNDATLDGYITAVVLAYRNAIPADATTGQGAIPACLYVKYFKGQTAAPYRTTFTTNEELYTVDANASSIITDSTFVSTKGKVATISPGIFYVNEYFVDCAQQSVIVEHDNTSVTDAAIVLDIVESIVTSDSDESLLDNANGAPNQYAPGADRYKIQLNLVVIRDFNLDAFDSDRYILMMNIVSNTVVFSNIRTEYAQIMRMLAERTYDANGNFIVEGLFTNVSLHPDPAYITAGVTPGKGYLGGYQYVQIADRLLPISKPRDDAHTETILNPGKFPDSLISFFVAGGAYSTQLPQENTLVQILDRPATDVAAVIIGYGVYRGIQYITGSVLDGTDIYKVYFDNITLEGGHTINDVGGIQVIGGGGTAVLHNITLTGLTGLFAAADTITSTTVANVTGTIYHVTNTTNLYVLKDTQYQVPSADVITNATSIANVSTYFVSNYAEDYLPIIEVDRDIIKTLYTNNTNTTSYSFVKRLTFNITSTSRSQTSTLDTNELFEDYSTSDFYAYVVDDGVFIDALDDFLTISGDLKDLTLDVSGSGSLYDDKTIWVYATVNKTNITEATKTLTNATTKIVLPSASYMALEHQDVAKIIKIVDGGIDPVTFQNTGDTVTLASHGLENGNEVMFTELSTSNGLSTYTRYFVANKTTDTFQLKLTLAGSVVTITADSTGFIAKPADVDNDTDITTRFTALSGNRGPFISAGMIKLKKNATPPVGQVAVRYQYYSVGNGGYVSVDSYGDYTGNLNYIGEILDVVTDKSNTVQISRYLDFRTRTSNYYFKNLATIANASNVLKVRDLNLTTMADELEGKYVVGPGFADGVTIISVAFNPATGNSELTLDDPVTGDQKGTYYIGLNTSNLSLVDTSVNAQGATYVYPKDQARLSYNYVKFTPKRTLVYLDRSQKDDLTVQQIEIQSSKDVDSIRRNPYKLPLMTVYMDPYCIDLEDVVVTKYNNPVYQMLDIDRIKKRVDRNEYYTNLALTKNIDKDRLDVVTGLNEYARGFFSENFLNLNAQEYDSPDFKCTIVDKSFVMPQTVVRTVNLELDENVDPSTWTLHSSAVTLPYENVLILANEQASKTNNLNPYVTIDWSSTGKITLNPAIDNWFDVTIDGSSTYTPPDKDEDEEDDEVDEGNSGGGKKPKKKKDKDKDVKKPEKRDKQHPKRHHDPAVVLPKENKGKEYVTEINNLKAGYGPDTRGTNTRVTFDWKTNKGKKGRVNTDAHLSKELAKYGYTHDIIKSLINKPYDEQVKELLNAGTHLDKYTIAWWQERYKFKPLNTK